MSHYTYHIAPPCEEEVSILFADDDVLVVDKPSGLLSVPGRFVKDCVLNRLLIDYPDATIVHRLDLDTSGLLVIARSKQAVSELNRQFRDREIEKEYIARVFGIPEASGEIDLPIRADPVNRPKQVIDQEAGKSAFTRYKLLSAIDGSGLLRLTPTTGRSHQLRIHMAAIGHPILGCDLYAHEEAFGASKRLMLHASGLGFKHPKSQEWQTFASDAPFE